jgi:hypothetical protein
MNLPRTLTELLQRTVRDEPTTGYSDVVRPMPRRTISHAVDSAAVSLPRARPAVKFKAGILRPISRMFVWLWGLIQFYVGNLIDVVLQRDTIERRAVRLRQVFEGAGPTFA